jgi:hypothetical protein
MCRNVRSIEWHKKTYHEISWDYPFKLCKKTHIKVCQQTLITLNFFRLFIVTTWSQLNSFISICRIGVQSNYNHPQQQQQQIHQHPYPMQHQPIPSPRQDHHHHSHPGRQLHHRQQLTLARGEEGRLGRQLTVSRGDEGRLGASSAPNLASKKRELFSRDPRRGGY